MPRGWEQALDTYSYRVDLREFSTDRRIPGWFECDLNPGDRRQTINFENRFRERAANHLEAWAEVVYWKGAATSSLVAASNCG